MLTNQMEADFLYCESIIKEQSKSFYYAFSSLPKEKANAVYAIYAFCRIADDTVDENFKEVDKINALNQLNLELDLFYQGKEINHPLWRALRYVFDHFDMEIDPFYDQLAGQKMDVHFEMPHSLAELEQYSYLVAGSVGLMLLPIIASESHTMLKQAAIDLGVAMQLTNILRDIGEDFYEKKRIYLPEEIMEGYGYTTESLESGTINQSFIHLWESLAHRAEYLYDCFSVAINQFDRDSCVSVALSANVYRGILDAVRENGYNCLTQRNVVNREKMVEMNETIRRIS